jgi:glycosyltransferase involved in cell wall biosynthesis
MRLGILFWKSIGLMRKKRVHCVIMSLPERLKYFSHHRWLVRFISYLLNKATTIFILSNCVKKDFVEKYIIKKQDDVKIFYFGIDIKFWKPQPKIPSENYILSIGNDMNRDFSTLIQALPNYAKLKLVTNKKIDSLNKNVEFFSKLSNQEVRTFYNQALFIVIPNIKLQNESSGLSCCLQAMACGKAVIIADAPPLRELFEDGKHCLFYDPENSVDLKNKIEFLLNNRQIREELAKNGYGLVCKNFTCKQMGLVEDLCILSISSNIIQINLNLR